MVLSLCAALAVVYAGVCLLLYIYQRSLIYFPQPRAPGSGTMMTLESGGERVMVTHRETQGGDALIYFGGNAEDVSLNLGDLARAFPDHALYLMHYRGYGGSSGKASEEALIADGLALFDRVYARHPRVVVVGRSLGSGVAVRLASERAVMRLVLVTPYESLLGIAAEAYGWAPVRWLLKDKFESWRYAERVTAPTLIVAAESDEVIPRWSTERLWTRFRAGTVSYIMIQGTGHNTISMKEEYWQALAGS